MPNGHGGYMRFGAPLLIWVIMVVVFVSDNLSAAGWYRPLLLTLSLLLGWKLALHIHMWHTLEYGGAYVSREEHASAQKKFAVGAVCYSVVGFGAVWLLTG
jgi:hypothetical protein